MTIVSKRLCDICNDCQTAMRCDTSLKLRMQFLLRLSKFFRCNFLCWHLPLFARFLIISIFRAIVDSHILQIVTLVQKLHKSFFGEIEFLAPSCSAGSGLMPNTLFGKIYILMILQVMFQFLKYVSRRIELTVNHNNTMCMIKPFSLSSIVILL